MACDGDAPPVAHYPRAVGKLAPPAGASLVITDSPLCSGGGSLCPCTRYLTRCHGQFPVLACGCQLRAAGCWPPGLLLCWHWPMRTSSASTLNTSHALDAPQNLTWLPHQQRNPLVHTKLLRKGPTFRSPATTFLLSSDEYFCSRAAISFIPSQQQDLITCYKKRSNPDLSVLDTASLPDTIFLSEPRRTQALCPSYSLGEAKLPYPSGCQLQD
jgi:hypothetical protein